MTKLLAHTRYGISLLLLGAAHAQAFAPGPLPGVVLPYAQLVCLVFLARTIWQASSCKRAAMAGLLFGIGSFTVGLYWIFISLHNYGGMNTTLAGTAVVLLGTAEALFICAATTATRWITQGRPLANSYARSFLVVAVWASCWTCAEWLRGTLFTGFPWMTIGYAHIDGPLAGWAPLIGVYGVTWLAAFAAGAAGLLLCVQRTGHEAGAAGTAAAAIVLALVGWLLGAMAWSAPQGPPVLLRLVQGNVPQSEKFDPASMRQGVQTYMELAALPPKEAGNDPAVIILPETIMPLFQDRYPAQTWNTWLGIAAQRNASLIMGVPLHTSSAQGDRYTNSAIGFDARTPVQELLSGQLAMRYDKHHLVPFGEFVPPGFRWFVDAMHIPLGDFNRGPPRQASFNLAGQFFGLDICYEDIFGEEIIPSVHASSQHGPGATILVNISNLGWFGDSWALRQHLQMSRMRARETARPIVRATNTGMTAAIDPDGQVRATLTAHTKGVLDVEVQGMSGLTPYARSGNSFVLAACLILLALALQRRRRD